MKPKKLTCEHSLLESLQRIKNSWWLVTFLLGTQPSTITIRYPPFPDLAPFAHDHSASGWQWLFFRCSLCFLFPYQAIFWLPKQWKINNNVIQKPTQKYIYIHMRYLFLSTGFQEKYIFVARNTKKNKHTQTKTSHLETCRRTSRGQLLAACLGARTPTLDVSLGAPEGPEIW